MTSLARVAAFSFAALACVCAPAFADDCGPLKQIVSMDATIAGPGGRMLVPVTINGLPRRMVVNTSGGLTSLTPGAVAALGLSTHDSNVKMLSGNGYASNRFVHLETFTVGNIQGKNVDLMVSPAPENEASAANDANTVVGSISGDLMKHYDVEIDFAHRKVNFFSPDHCEGRVVYWENSGIAVVPFTTNRPAQKDPFTRNNQLSIDTHIHVPVTIDGKPFMADINTAAPNSSMSADIAETVFGITADSPGSVPMGVAEADPRKKIFGHVFTSLDFGDIAVTHAHMVIRPDLVGAKDPNNSYTTGSLITRVDDGIGPAVSVGMDVLRHLRVYIAYDEGKLYLTAASVAEAPPAAKP